jgi:hypothetical protein
MSRQKVGAGRISQNYTRILEKLSKSALGLNGARRAPLNKSPSRKIKVVLEGL